MHSDIFITYGLELLIPNFRTNFDQKDKEEPASLAFILSVPTIFRNCFQMRKINVCIGTSIEH